MEIVLGSGDGAGVRGHATSSGLKLDWSSTSRSSSNWFWSNANAAEGSDPSSLNLTDLNPSDVTLSRVSDPNWGGAIDNLAVTNNATGKTLTITREFSGYSVLDHGQITAAASANLQAGSADVTLNAPDGTATLTAGTGNDMLVGGTGNDTFVYKAIDGNLLIQDHADASQAARSNTLQLTDLNATDISFTQQNNDLVLAIAGTGRAITIGGEFTSADHDGVRTRRAPAGALRAGRLRDVAPHDDLATAVAARADRRDEAVQPRHGGHEARTRHKRQPMCPCEAPDGGSAFVDGSSFCRAVRDSSCCLSRCARIGRPCVGRGFLPSKKSVLGVKLAWLHAHVGGVLRARTVAVIATATG